MIVLRFDEKLAKAQAIERIAHDEKRIATLDKN